MRMAVIRTYLLHVKFVTVRRIYGDDRSCGVLIQSLQNDFWFDLT